MSENIHEFEQLNNPNEILLLTRQGHTLAKDTHRRPIDDPLGDARIILKDGPAVEVGPISDENVYSTSSFRAVPLGTLPSANETELKEHVAGAILTIGDRREGGPEIGFREGLMNLTLTYVRLTYGTARPEKPPEWLRQMAIDKVEANNYAALLKEWDQQHVYDKRLGSDFDSHYKTACEKVDRDPMHWLVFGIGSDGDEIVSLLHPKTYKYVRDIQIRRERKETDELLLRSRNAVKRLNLDQATLAWLRNADEETLMQLHDAAKMEGDADTENLAKALLHGHEVF